MKMYLEENNGGRNVLIENNNKWYAYDCAPSGYWGDVDIYESNIPKVISALKSKAEEFSDYDYYDEDEIPEYEGMTIEEIEEKEYQEIDCPLYHFVYEE